MNRTTERARAWLSSQLSLNSAPETMEVLSVWPSTLIIQFKFLGISSTIWFKMTATFWISNLPGNDKSAFPTSNKTSEEKTNLSPTILIPSLPSTNSRIRPKKSDL